MQIMMNTLKKLSFDIIFFSEEIEILVENHFLQVFLGRDIKELMEEARKATGEGKFAERISLLMNRQNMTFMDNLLIL